MDDPRTRLPLPAHDFHILLSVFEQGRHGYGIIQAISEQTQGETTLGTSTLYAALKRLASANLISETARPSGEVSRDDRRRYYKATTFGRAVARAEARRIGRLHSLATDAQLLERAPGHSRGGSR